MSTGRAVHRHRGGCVALSAARARRAVRDIVSRARTPTAGCAAATGRLTDAPIRRRRPVAAARAAQALRRGATRSRGIDLTVEPGEVVAFLGPNGAGKTTTIDMLLGLARPTPGTRRGARLDAAPRGRARPGLRRDADRRAAQGPHRRARRSSSPRPVPRTRRPVDEVLERAGIADIADRRVGKCSGGQQQRLRFAMALLPDPELLDPRRADHRHGRRGPPRLLGRHPRGRRAGPHRRCSPRTTSRRPTPTPTGSCWSATAGSSPTAPRPRSRRWPPAGRVRATLPGADAAERAAALPGVDSVEVRGDTVLDRTPRHRRASPATC